MRGDMFQASILYIRNPLCCRRSPEAPTFTRPPPLWTHRAALRTEHPHHSVHATVSTRSVRGSGGALQQIHAQNTSHLTHGIRSSGKRQAMYARPLLSSVQQTARARGARQSRYAANHTTTAHSREHEAHQASLTRDPPRLQRCAELRDSPRDSRSTGGA